jgi:hypothetical protein
MKPTWEIDCRGELTHTTCSWRTQNHTFNIGIHLVGAKANKNEGGRGGGIRKIKVLFSTYVFFGIHVLFLILFL